MPIQAPQWTDYLNCPVCCREFGAPPRSPVSLVCGHTLCRHCLKHLHRKQCPFDQTVIQAEPDELVVNTALLQLAGFAPPPQPHHPPCVRALPEPDRQAYDVVVHCLEHMAVYLKYCGNANSNQSGSRLSRPMQRKLVTLLQCAITDEEGRGKAARAARSLGERTVTELILQHQNPQQLSANLWAAVRARGCQFLGPAMQEEVLKLVLLALEDGSALSRKVLVMFVVQRLEPHFPQASKTSIGHVVQLLYRASCFKVSKRESDSSLMELKEEFRTYESLRREHDAQIVQIATEAGLRIAPDQWSALLYGDTTHKSHMQSIIDKLQTPQSFSQSVQELFIALQRTGDPAQLVLISMHLDILASIDPNPDSKSPSWKQLAETMTSLKEVVSGLIHYLQHHAARDNNHNHSAQKHALTHEYALGQTSPPTGASTPTHGKYKGQGQLGPFCTRGGACPLLHPAEDADRYRVVEGQPSANYAYLPQYPAPMPLHQPMPQMYPRYPPPPPLHRRLDNYPPNMNAGLPPPALPTDTMQGESVLCAEGLPPGYQPALLLPMGERQYFPPRFARPPEDAVPAQLYARSVYQPTNSGYCFEEPNVTMPVAGEMAPEYRPNAAPVWPARNEVFEFDAVRAAMPHAQAQAQAQVQPQPTCEDVYKFDDVLNPMTRVAPNVAQEVQRNLDLLKRADDEELEEELQALERRIDTEF